MTAPPDSIRHAPAPWTCKCEAYWLMLYTSGPLPDNVYAPLEAASSSFADPKLAGKFRGGVGNIQIVRYSDTPAGNYDELVILPGFFEVPGTSRKHTRVTRIYVSQKDTCYNGRKNWGIPKHLARFSFSHPPTVDSPPAQALKVEVFPPDPNASRPFFSVTLHPFRWLPAIPFSTKTLPYIGLDPHLVQPPLPAGAGPGEPELAGTENWLKTLPYLHAEKARGAWVEVHQIGKKSGSQENAESQALLGGNQEELEKWWPRTKPWKMGLWLEDATLVFAEPEILK